MIILAQIIVAVQMVLEEKFVYKHDVHPLRAVGTEGMYTPCQTCKGKTVTLSSLSAVYRSTRFYLWLFNHKSHFCKRSLSKNGRRGYNNTRMNEWQNVYVPFRNTDNAIKHYNVIIQYLHISVHSEKKQALENIRTCG